MMKLISLLLAAGSLGGCVAYPAHYGGGGPVYYSPGAYYGGAPVVMEQPVYLYGYGGYTYRPEPRPDWRWRHRHRDRDRDGNGSRNRADRYPDNPRRR